MTDEIPPGDESPVPPEDAMASPFEPTSTGHTPSLPVTSFEPSEPVGPVRPMPDSEVPTDSGPHDPLAEIDEERYSDDDLVRASDMMNDVDDPFSPAPGPAAPPPPRSSAGPVQPPHHVPRRRLYRSTQDRKVSGVSGGLAEYFAIDAALVRIVVLLLFFSGIGIVAYLLAWLIVPSRPTDVLVAPLPPATQQRQITQAFGLAALALALGVITGSWALLAVALIGGGAWLLSEQTQARPAAAVATPAPMQFTVPQPRPADFSTTATAPSHYQTSTYSSATTIGSPSPAPTYATPQRPRQRISWIVLSLLALLGAFGWSAATGNWFDVDIAGFFGIGLAIVGGGVVLGQARGGGARGMIPLGILIALLLIPLSATNGLLLAGTGERVVRPASLAGLESNYEHGIGKLTVDLSQIDFADQTRAIDIGLGVGELVVLVAPAVGGEAQINIGAGGVVRNISPEEAFGGLAITGRESFDISGGINIAERAELVGESGALDLSLRVGLGTAEVRVVGNR